MLKALPEVVKDVSALLDQLPDPGDSSEKLQFAENLRRTWLTQGLPWQRAAGQRLLDQAPISTSGAPLAGELRLLDEEDVELQILAGRLAQTLAAPSQDEFNDLQQSYGRCLRVDLLHKLHDERKYASLDDLQGISGMGAKKLEAYGADVLRVVRAG